MKKLILNQQMKDAININELAYFLEKSNPNLNFFQINKLVKEILQSTHLSLVKSDDVDR